MSGELRALGRLAFRELGAAPGGIAQVHRAVADRAWRPGPGRTLHDAISRGVYAAVAGGFGLAARAAGGALPDRVVSTTPGGAAAIAAVNGLIGDVLEREGSELVQPMSIRVAGRVVDPGSVPGRTPWLVVFVHGLFETEFSWGLGGRETYGSRLARDLGCTPVYVRYNAGRHVSENGRSLAELMDDLVREWPVAVERIALVGHSMGGLVARSACHHGGEWVRHVRHVVTLGSPHSGAPLEQAVHAASAALGALPETRPLAGFLRRRSGGIRDLRHGSLVDEDWRGRDPDALRAAACQEVPLLDGVTHCFVAATMTRDPRHPVGRLVGDWLVLEPSASYKAEHAFHVGGLHHLALLNHPEVYERLATVLRGA